MARSDEDPSPEPVPPGSAAWLAAYSARLAKTAEDTARVGTAAADRWARRSLEDGEWSVDTVTADIIADWEEMTPLLGRWLDLWLRPCSRESAPASRRAAPAPRPASRRAGRHGRAAHPGVPGAVGGRRRQAAGLLLPVRGPARRLVPVLGQGRPRHDRRAGPALGHGPPGPGTVSFTAGELLAMTERALDRLDWGQVYALASDVLALEPDNREATVLRDLAERRGGRNTPPGRRQATALYADLVGSTPLAERYDVEVYSGVLRAFEQACRPAVDEHEGHFVDLKGDALVACFGYPSAHEDDACRAVDAALGMLAALRPLAAVLKAEQGIDLAARIGIDTGLVVIDGAGVRGATLNRAARLQTLAEPGTVVVSAPTNELVADQFETRPLGRRRLKGIDGPVEVFQVVRPRARVRHQRAAPSTSGPFIGRDAELRQVLDLWDRTVAAAQPAVGPAPATATGAMVLISGDPGIGKSRLTAVVAERSAEAGMPTIDLQCSSYSVTSTLFPLRTALERYANMSLDDTGSERLAKLEATLAGLQTDIDDSYFSALGMLLDLDLAGRYPVVELAPIQLREFLLDRLVGLLRAVGAYSPTIMAFEDLHWADPTTLELLDRLAAAGPPAGLLILGTARPDLAWRPDPKRALTIQLRPLTDAQARELALAAAPGPISERHAEEIAAI